tara:strand:- start:2512 stop:2979 length:468 start_codon:yes stop_codon:yes gene_type:complete
MSAIDIKIDKRDLARLSKKIQLLKKESTTELSKNIAHAAVFIQNKAIDKAPVYKGTQYTGGDLKQSIGSEARGTTAVIFAKAKYAPYQEFGTGTRVDVKDAAKLGIPPSEIKRLYQGDGKRKVNINPQPFFFPAVRIGLNKLLKDIEKDLKKLTK